MWSREQLAHLRGVLKQHGCSDPGAVLEAIGELVAVYGPRNMPPERAAAYARHLADVDPAALAVAVAELVRSSSSDWPPSIGRIRERVAGKALAGAGMATSPEDAWIEVLTKVRSIGIRRLPGQETEHGPPVVFDDPITASIVDAHTWRTLGNATDLQIPSERRAFIDRYKAAAARLRDEVQTGRALGPAAKTAALGPERRA